MILRFPGAPALSVFRAEKLLGDLQHVEPSIQSVTSQYIHFVATERDLTVDEQTILIRILEPRQNSAFPSAAARCFLVIPRSGTISPWSSKATDIAKHCGLDVVKRIERGIAYIFDIDPRSDSFDSECEQVFSVIHDRMTQIVVAGNSEFDLFAEHSPAALETIPLLKQGDSALVEANLSMGLALSGDEIEYLATRFKDLDRNPTDVELMMFSQANSEHCRHKIFNANWRIDAVERKETLFGMIRNTNEKSGWGVLSAYKDNAAVMEGLESQLFLRDSSTGKYGYVAEPAHILMKVETHNHPTAISPFPGAATGSGGEIRDELATGRGAMCKAGLTGFSVSNLKIPGFIQPWEVDYGKPERIASALQIMLDGPLGGAAFNNEFGRPNLSGYFRTFEQKLAGEPENLYRGYHKPIMIAGGMGNIRPGLVEKQTIPYGASVVVLGGPGMLIGLGGGAASSQASGASSENLDFASVQRENPEMQRRCQEVISQCWALGKNNPIVSIHDVGAGGLANAVPEIIHDSGCGGYFELRSIPNADPGMSPMQLWCNESQERFVLAIHPQRLESFEAFCRRERCTHALIGIATDNQHLILHDEKTDANCIDIPMSLLFGDPPKMLRDAVHVDSVPRCFDSSNIELEEAVKRVLQFPSVADKSFLITIGDRSVTGLVVRDQMVGPWQVPVADVAVTSSGFRGNTGEAMAMGERAPLALINAPASGRMAIGEALTNLCAAMIGSLTQVKLSANWMAAAGHCGEDAALFDTVRAIGLELCPALGLSIPVGKDSLSMKTVWRDGQKEKSMVGPLSLVVTAFAPVIDTLRILTPELRSDCGESSLLLIDLGVGRNRLGGSALTQVYNQLGDDAPDLDDVELFNGFFQAIQRLNQRKQLLAYHDRSDGGLLACLCEMAFASRTGLTIDLSNLVGDPIASLFSEELGAVIQIRRADLMEVLQQFNQLGLGPVVHDIGTLDQAGMITFNFKGKSLFSSTRTALQQYWSETSYRMQVLRDNPETAGQWFDSIEDDADSGLNVAVSFKLSDDITAAYVNCKRPKVAILREQGINGHIEMAAAFDQARFDCIDVHMSDIVDARINLKEFVGIAACGGFSYGDVLGAGAGWAKSILFNNRSRDQFADFFHRTDTFGLGVCNGCQMLSQLKELIIGAQHWPTFVKNTSEQFEARVALVEVQNSTSVLFAGMEGTRIPVSVAHGEGRAEFVDDPHSVIKQGLVTLRYVDYSGVPTEKYPANPNGTPFGITGLSTIDGRFTIMMPHPERCFRSRQNSWHPSDWGEYGPWLQLFRNARVWVG